MKASLISSAAAFLLLLSACSGSDAETAASDASEESGEETADETSLNDYEYESPLGEFLGWSDVNFDAEDAEAEFAQQEREVQEDIAACMRAEGFEYTPVDNSEFFGFDGEESPDGLEWGSRAWTEKYGYGVSTQQFSQSQVGDDLVGHLWDEVNTGDDAPQDPNQAYLETLSDSERQAYDAALWGSYDAIEEPDWAIEGREPTDEELEAYEAQFEELGASGCQEQAYEAVYETTAGPDEELFTEFEEEFADIFEELEQRMESHPDVIAHREGIEACMSEKGLEYFSQTSGDSDVYEYFNGLIQDANIGPDWEADPLADVDTTGWTDEQFEQAYNDVYNQPLPADQLEELGKIQALEIETAVGELDCGGGWRNELEATDAIRIELEQEFLDQNAEQLAKYEGAFSN